MGTNYYFVPADQTSKVYLHIGKSSVGWQFLFRTHPGIKSYRDWVRILKEVPGKIVDEYDRAHQLQTFMNWVEGKKLGESRGYETGGCYPMDRLDEDGYWFSDREFS